jgi:hypothetical protein
VKTMAGYCLMWKHSDCTVCMCEIGNIQIICLMGLNLVDEGMAIYLIMYIFAKIP